MKRIGRFLAYINRARQYQGIVSSFMLLIILLKQFDITLSWYWYPALIPATAFLLLVIGFIDTKIGVRKAEIYDIEKNSPIRMEDHRMIKDIHKKLI